MQRRQHLPFHIGGTTPEQEITPYLGFKGVRLPQVQGIDRLDIVVSVDKDCGSTWVLEVIAINDRMSLRWHDLHVLDVELLQMMCHPLRGAQDVLLVFIVRGDRRNFQHFDQLIQKFLTVLFCVIECFLKLSHDSSSGARERHVGMCLRGCRRGGGARLLEGAAGEQVPLGECCQPVARIVQ